MLQNANTESSQNANITERAKEQVTQTTSVAYQSVNDLTNSLIHQLPYAAAGLLVLIFFWFLSKIFKSIFWAASNKTHLDNRLRILFSRLISISIFVLGIFAALTIIIPTFRFGDLIAGLGFTSFIVGFATQDILKNLLSGVLILWKQPFHIGDYIFVKDHQGKVEYIGVRATRLRMDDGEMILVPNGDMYSNALIIRGAGAERRMNLKINLGYKTDIEQAKAIIYEALESLKGVIDEPKPSVFVTDLASSGVNLSIFFWINTNDSRPMEIFDRVATEIKKALSKSNIELYATS